MKFFLSILFITNITYSQNPDIEWQNTINANGFDTISTSVQSSDGGTLLVATSDSDISGDKSENSNGGNDIWIVKVDNLGTVQWQQTIGGSLSDFINMALETQDGGFVLAGGSKSNISGDKTEENIGDNDVWIIKINATGIIEWQSTIGGTASDSARAISTTSDNGYIISASSESSISGNKTDASKGRIDIWLLKLNNLGDILWQKTIGSNNDDIPSVVKQTTDGGYIIGSYSNSGISGDKTEDVSGFQDFWVIKTDSSGIIEWENTIGGNSGDVLRDLEILNNGNYILAGYSNSDISLDKTENSKGSFDYWIVEINNTGDLVWQKTIGGNNDDFASNITVTSDNNYLIAGQSRSDATYDKAEDSKGAVDFWPMKISTTGSILWQKTIGGSSNDNLIEAHETNDGYILSGHSLSDISGDKTENSLSIDIWVVKLGQEPTASLQENDYLGIKLFPNPTTSALSVASTQPLTINIYDIIGNEVLVTSLSKIDVSKLPTGVYIVKILNGKGEELRSQKLIKN